MAFMDPICLFRSYEEDDRLRIISQSYFVPQSPAGRDKGLLGDSDYIIK